MLLPILRICWRILQESGSAGVPGLRVAESLEEICGRHPFLAGELDLGQLQGAVGGGDGQTGLAVGEDGARGRVQVGPLFGPVNLQGRLLACLERSDVRISAPAGPGTLRLRSR